MSNFQTDIFGGEAEIAAQAAVEPHIVLRRPGWSLVASRSTQPQWWHLLRTTGALGSVVTRCGMTGRVVPEDQRQIALCPACEAVA